MPQDQLPRDYRTKLIAGTRLLQVHQLEEAILLLEQAHSLCPDEFDAILNLSAAYILTKHWKQAVHLLETTTRHISDNVQLWINLGAAYLGNPILATGEQQRNAISAFRSALELDPEAYNVHYNIALVHRDRGEFSEAIEMLEHAIRVNAADHSAQRLLQQLQAKVEASSTEQET